MEMENWLKALRYDPLNYLEASESKAVELLVKRDLYNEASKDIRDLWTLPEVMKIVDKQQNDGSWKYANVRAQQERPFENYSYLETYRNFGMLVEKYGMDYEHHSTAMAVDYLFTLQTDEGDFRGIYGKQYSPNYSAGIMELMIKAGYADHPGIQKGFEWLLSVMQDDGGWAIPLRTRGAKLDRKILESPPLLPDRSKPFSHLVTGVVLRTFAVHSKYKRSEEALHAGDLLKSRFFLPDKYSDRRAPSFWSSVSFPFWFTDIVSSLDSLSLMGYTADDGDIKGALEWLANRQAPDGSWDLNLLKDKHLDQKRWVSLAICRIFRRFYP
jgi:hypothetical protein